MERIDERIAISHAFPHAARASRAVSMVSGLTTDGVNSRWEFEGAVVPGTVRLSSHVELDETAVTDLSTEAREAGMLEACSESQNG